LFDLDQIRTVQFPLGDGSCPPSALGPAITALRTGLSGMADQRSPVFETVEGYTTRHRAGIEEFEQLVSTLSGFQKDVSTIKATADRDQRRTLTLQLLKEYGQQKAVQETVAIQIVELVRDHVGPEATLEYIASLDEDVRNHTSVIEQQQIALSNSDNVVEAAATLELLIERVGPTSDRCGILGGRYKKLMGSGGRAPPLGRRVCHQHVVVDCVRVDAPHLAWSVPDQQLQYRAPHLLAIAERTVVIQADQGLLLAEAVEERLGTVAANVIEIAGRGQNVLDDAGRDPPQHHAWMRCVAAAAASRLRRITDPTVKITNRHASLRPGLRARSGLGPTGGSSF
jgi:hypothetical protein